ncbi:hypothetical protein DL765_008589 [Monosporascus sp. GIB2]|nr:hypothetical protein DL765_008589 [Monosporascus sp. GIB2]
MPSYKDFVTTRSRTNPGIVGLAEHLGRAPSNESTVILLDYPQDGEPSFEPLGVSATDIGQLVQIPPIVHGRILFVENIQPRLISLLGESLDIDPVFFAGHITTDFEDIEKAPPPPFLALFPSQIAEKCHLHIHYQRVVDLGSSDVLAGSTATAWTYPSVLFRSVEKAPGFVDMPGPCRSTVEIFIETPKSEARKVFLPEPLHGGFEDFAESSFFPSHKFTANYHLWEKTSMIGSLLHYFRNHPPGFTRARPSILSLSYYPVRIVLAEWILYTNLMSRYIKYYEYSLHDIQDRLHGSDVADLQRWRRRSKQSYHKLTLLAEFVNYWAHEEADRQPWD